MTRKTHAHTRLYHTDQDHWYMNNNWCGHTKSTLANHLPVWFWRCVCKHSCMMTSSNGNIFRVTGPLCGEFTGPGDFPTQRPVTRSFDVFFDLRLNKRLSKQSWGWWFETPSWSLWRHGNVNFICCVRSFWLTFSIIPYFALEVQTLLLNCCYLYLFFTYLIWIQAWSRTCNRTCRLVLIFLVVLM